LRHGFKAEAERIALRERAALGLTATDRLDPRDLAAQRTVAVTPLGQLRALIPDDVEHLLVVDGSCFSAATVIRDGKAMVIYNEAHAPTRLANTIAHELAHLILEHEPTNAFDAFGNRNFPSELEDEANWLAACLLVPKDGVQPILVSHGNDVARAAAHFGVSPQLMQWRVNATRWRPRRSSA
jgi:IrrE N-terminal-like domain